MRHARTRGSNRCSQSSALDDERGHPGSIRCVNVMTSTTTTEPRAHSAAAPSPFPPIAEYAFLSDCHTGALVAPDGAIDWLCMPSFDAPSVFGSLIDREAGTFRFGPFGINHPTARSYEPGTNVLVTTWRTPRGWIVVRDGLTMGPRPSARTSLPTPGLRRTTTATTCWSARSSASRAASRSSSSASPPSTTAAPRRAGRWSTAGPTWPRRVVPARQFAS